MKEMPKWFMGVCLSVAIAVAVGASKLVVAGYDGKLATNATEIKELKPVAYGAKNTADRALEGVASLETKFDKFFDIYREDRKEDKIEQRILVSRLDDIARKR